LTAHPAILAEQVDRLATAGWTRNADDLSGGGSDASKAKQMTSADQVFEGNLRVECEEVEG